MGWFVAESLHAGTASQFAEAARTHQGDLHAKLHLR